MERAELVQRSRRSFTRLARFINQLMREQLSSCCPITVQQCYTLEALMEGPKSMKILAAEVAIHQSTLTRIVEKLEKQDLVRRARKPGNQRSVEVQITEAGKGMYLHLDTACSHMISELLAMIPEDRQVTVVEAMETLADLLDPQNEAFQALLRGCCGESEKGAEK